MDYAVDCTASEKQDRMQTKIELMQYCHMSAVTSNMA